MAKYPDFKSYMQANYEEYLKKRVHEFVQGKHDESALCIKNAVPKYDQRVDKLEIKSLRCIDMPDPYMKIEVNLTADIVTNGNKTQKLKTEIETRWFTVSVIACFDNSTMTIGEEANVREYAPNSWDKTTVFDEYGLPYICNDDLEEIADEFVKKYVYGAPRQLYYCFFPDGYVANKLGVDVYAADLPENTMGRIYFRKDKETIYTNYRIYLRGEDDKPIQDDPWMEESKKEVTINPGTILISRTNHYMIKTGSSLMTIAHEMIHWLFHQKFFKILSLLNSEINMVTCEVEPDALTDSMDSLSKAKWFAEWQANALSMRITIPRLFFKDVFELAHSIAVDEEKKCIKKILDWNKLFVSADDVSRLIQKSYVLENTIKNVAKLFGTSVFAAKQRALQLGWDIADGTNNYIEGKHLRPFTFAPGTLGPKQTFVISQLELDKICAKNPHFKEMLDSGMFIYLECLVCINDEQYVQKIKDDYSYYDKLPIRARIPIKESEALSDYARDHVDECCLVFNWESATGLSGDGGFYGQSYLCRDITAVNRIEHEYDPSFENNQSVESVAKAVAKYKQIYKNEKKVLKDTPDNFGEAIVYHMKRKKITVEDLAFRSGLSETTIVVALLV